MSDPFLDFGDVGLVFEGVGRGRGSERVWAKVLDVDADVAGLMLQDGVDGLGA